MNCAITKKTFHAMLPFDGEKIGFLFGIKFYESEAECVSVWERDLSERSAAFADRLKRTFKLFSFSQDSFLHYRIKNAQVLN